MAQLPHSRPEGFANNNALYADGQQQYNPYDSLSHAAGADQTLFDDSWGVRTGNYGLQQSRSQAQSPSWASHGNNNHALQSHAGNLNGQPSPYARPVSQSPAPYGQHGYNGYDPAQNFQYHQTQSPYDPALFQSMSGQNLNYSTNKYQTTNAGTIAPQALQQETRSPAFNNKPNFAAYPGQANSLSNDVVDQQKLIGAIPVGADAGLFSIIDFDTLANATNTTRMGNYANVGLEVMNWDCNRATLPQYIPRRSRNELRRSAGNDAKLLHKIGKKSTKMQRIAAAPKTVHGASVASVQPTEKIKYEGETSSEESSSEDDDESSYTSDEEAESAPLPNKRPDNPKAGTEYDTVKALWRSKRKSLSSDSIRKGLVDFWEIAKTVRDRWKADANAFEEAKKKGQKSQLPLLESRVKDQRDMMEVAFKAALKHGHRAIVEIMSENESLIYLCYQFLLDRAKAEDYNSPLSRTMLELVTIWTSLTEERVEKTHLNKPLARYAKYGDAKTKYYANKITSNATIASKDAKEKTVTAQAKKSAPAGDKAGSPIDRHAEPVAGTKRPASGAAGEASAAKKLATGATKTNGVTMSGKQTGAGRKPSTAVDTTKSIATAAAPVIKTKSVVAKPSGIFSSLTAARKPGTSTASKTATTGALTASKLAEKKATAAPAKSTFSFAETMASLNKPKPEKQEKPKPEKQLPPETPEEKAKRLRKESRRHLRVSFKREDELTEVRFFTHDPDEELGHDASQMRDVSDVGGEGRMFKQQHQMMDVDEDDDTPEEGEKSLVTFREPGLIDFKDIDADERARNYNHRGGGELDVESKERADRDYYDANNLIVFYTTSEDIPPNPREPSNPYSGEAVGNVRNFASPEDKYATRARQKRATQSPYLGSQQHQYTAPSAAPPPFDAARFSRLIGQQPHMHQSQAPNQQNIESILAALKPQNQNQSTPSAAFPPAFQPPPPMSSMHAAQQSQMQPQALQPQLQVPGGLDLAALLAQINQGGAGAAAPPAMGGGGGYGAQPPAMNFGQPYTNPQPPWPQHVQDQGQGAGRGDNRMTSETRSNPLTNKKYKTKVCQFWQKGTCQKGESCSYKHTND